MASQQSKCGSIPIVYAPDPSFKIYNGKLNYLDRDYWNQSLEKRSFLLNRPPVHHLQYPQSTELCNFKGYVPPVLTDGCLNQQSKEYYDRYLSDNPGCLGLPTRGNDFCPSKSVCSVKCPPMNDGSIHSEYGSRCAPQYRGGVPARQSLVNLYNKSYWPDRQKYSTPVAGVNRNIDSESSLKRLDHYCPSDVMDNRLVSNKVPHSEFIKYFPTCVKPLKGIETPFVWNNVTKMLNRYSVDSVPNSGFPKC